MGAKRRALLLDIGFGTLQGSFRSAARMAAHLTGRGFECTSLCGPEVVRARVQAELVAQRHELAEGDAFVLYFVGHGDKLRGARTASPTAIPPLGTDVLLLITHDIFLDQDPPRPGIAGVELLEWLAPIAETTGDVTVILDCCRAAGMTAGAAPVDPATRARIDDTLARAMPDLRQKYGVPAPRSEASEAAIVRLVATTQNEYAVERELPDGRIGLFTAALVEILERHPDDDLSWDELMPELQERTLAECATQRPGVEGARYRLPFSRRERPPLDEYPCRATRAGWQLQAGTLYGIDAGDRFTLGPVSAVVIDAAADVARLELDAPAELPALIRARRVGCVRRHAVVWPVGLAHPPCLGLAPELLLVDRHPDPPNPDLIAVVEHGTCGLVLREPDNFVVHTEPTITAAGQARLVEAMRRVARWRRQSAVLAELAAGSLLHCAWGLFGSDEPLPADGAELCEGDRVWVRVWGTGERSEVFVSLFHLRADRSLVHLTADLDHGISVARNRSTDLTLPPGGEPRPVHLHWHEHVPRDRPHNEALVLLASVRPRAFHRVATTAVPGPCKGPLWTPRGGLDPASIAAHVLSYRLAPAKG